MVVKKERLITDVMTCIFFNKTLFFSIIEMLLCGLDGILSSCMAQLLLNCFENMLLCNVYHQNDVADIGYFGLRELTLNGYKIQNHQKILHKQLLGGSLRSELLETITTNPPQNRCRAVLAT